MTTRDPFRMRDVTFFFRKSAFTHLGVFESGKLAGRGVRGVFDVNFFDRKLGSMRVAAEDSQFLAPTSELEGADANDVIIIDARRYTVAAHHRDGTGLSLLDLAEVIDTDIGEVFDT